jgi:hypothetical protein
MLSYISVHNVATSSCIHVHAFCNLMLPPRGMVLFNEWLIIVFVEDCRVSSTGSVRCIIRVVHNWRAVDWTRTIFWAGWALWWRARSPEVPEECSRPVDLVLVALFRKEYLVRFSRMRFWSSIMSCCNPYSYTVL